MAKVQVKNKELLQMHLKLYKMNKTKLVKILKFKIRLN